jgi:tetraacyldisaccharide 4'-kinase
VHLRSATSDTQPLDRVVGARVAAFAGIGNPAAFRATIETLGATLVGFRPFPDHHAYTPIDLRALGDWATGLRADLVVTTLKDLVKVRADRLGDRPLFALEVALELLPDTDAAGLEAALATILQPAVLQKKRQPHILPLDRTTGTVGVLGNEPS